MEEEEVVMCVKDEEVQEASLQSLKFLLKKRERPIKPRPTHGFLGNVSSKTRSLEEAHLGIKVTIPPFFDRFNIQLFFCASLFLAKQQALLTDAPIIQIEEVVRNRTPPRGRTPPPTNRHIAGKEIAFGDTFWGTPVSLMSDALASPLPAGGKVVPAAVGGSIPLACCTHGAPPPLCCGV